MPEDNPSETAILGTLDAWNKAFARNDVETFFGYLDEAITIIIPSSPYRIDGKETDKEEFLLSLGRMRTQVHLFQPLQLHLQVFGNVAVASYHARGAYGPDGVLHYTKETDVLVKDQGQWRIVHIHVSKAT